MRPQRSLSPTCRAVAVYLLIGAACAAKDPDQSAPSTGAGTGALPVAGSDAAGASAGSSGTTGAVGTPSGAGGGSGLSASGTGSAGLGGNAAAAGTTVAGTGSDPGDAGTTDGGPSTSGECTRELLGATVDQFFEALAANDASSLPVAASVKVTENGEELELGAGLWEGAGEVAFKLSALDTETCSSVTEAVVAEGSGDIPVGVRLALVAGQITEVETIAVRSGDYFVSSNTDFIIESAEADWAEPAIVPEADRKSRAELITLVDDYFTRFPAGACDFASDCVRLENGFSPGGCSLGLSCSTSGSGSGGMQPRTHVIDVEAGIAVGFVMFAGSYTDFHMFKVYAGEVHGVHAVLASADQSGWD